MNLVTSLLLICCFCSVFAQFGDVRTVFTFPSGPQSVFYDVALGYLYATDTSFNGVYVVSIGADESSLEIACDVQSVMVALLNDIGGFFPLWEMNSIISTDKGNVYIETVVTHNSGRKFSVQMVYDPLFEDTGLCELRSYIEETSDFYSVAVAVDNNEGLLYTLSSRVIPFSISASVLDTSTNVEIIYNISGSSTDYESDTSNIIVIKDSGYAFFAVCETNCELWMLNATGAYLVMELDASHNTDNGLHLDHDESKMILSVFSDTGISFVKYDTFTESFISVTSGVTSPSTSTFLPISSAFYYTDVTLGVVLYNTSTFPPTLVPSDPGVFFSGDALDNLNLFFADLDATGIILVMEIFLFDDAEALTDGIFDETLLATVPERSHVVVKINNGTNDLIGIYDIENGATLVTFAVPFSLEFLILDGGRGIVGGWSSTQADIFAISYSDCTNLGFYGDFCLLQCPCNLDQGTCSDGVAGNGTCYCDDGWDVETGCYDCDNQHYGNSCAMCTCNTANGACNSGMSGNGTCSSCYGNFGGNNCDECSGNFAGESCDECSGNWDGENCDACLVGWSGETCELCDLDYYGDECTPCDCPANSFCNDGFFGIGDCGCLSGWTGDDCDACLAEHYGDQCTPCDCPANSSCDDELAGSGECTCDAGLTGENCDQVESSEQDSNSIPNHSVTLMVSFVFLVVVL